MKILDRSLLAQIIVVICRPFVFIWSVSLISNNEWARWYLMALGLMPLFAIVDVFFQSAARHAFIAGAVPPRITWGHFLGAGLIFVFLITALFRLTFSVDISVTVMALVAVYFFSAFLFKFEASISSSSAVFSMSITELLGYLICALIALTGSGFIAAICATMVFPSSRIFTVLLNQRSDPAMPIAPDASSSRSVFIGSAVSSQVFASLAAGAPSIVSFVTPGAVERIGSALITFKVLFAVSALLSTAVNLLSIRVFYRVLDFNLGPGVAIVKLLERVLLVGLPVGLIIALAALPFLDAPLLIISVGLGIAFSYLNLLSSLAIMRGRPSISAAAQACVFISAFSLAFLFNDKIVIASVSLLLFLIGFYALSLRARVSVLLRG